MANKGTLNEYLPCARTSSVRIRIYTIPSASILSFLGRRVGAAVVVVATWRERWGVRQTTTTTIIMVQMAPRARSVVPGRNDETLYRDVPVHVLRATKVAVPRCQNPLLPRLLTAGTLLGASHVLGCAEHVLRPPRRAQRVRKYVFLQSVVPTITSPTNY